ncbi:MAG: hypothetical protein GF308_18480 [Candidatus Heimdallarchaeota archaeon]|nr:hypothetical protein [Candidatus Heimdallarchaeota archaeon]
MRIKHINLAVTINPNDSELACQGSIQMSNPEEKPFIHLNKLLELEELYLKEKNSRIDLAFSPSEIDPEFFIKASKKWSIELPANYQEKEELELFFKYRGKIQRDEPYKTNYLTSEAIELAIYVAWYPIVELDDNPTFQVKLKRIDNWLWTMNAPRKSESENTIVWERKDPATDLTLLGRPKTTAITKEMSAIFWGDKSFLENFSSLEQDILGFKQKLEDWLGKPKNDAFQIAISSRESGGTYVRQGLISTQGNLPEEYFTTKKKRFLLGWMHEIAHLWFAASEKSTYHNWLDEAIADYSALLLSELFYGKKFFEEILEKHRKMIEKEKDLPAIKEITRSHEKSYIVFYKWGSLILHEIRRKIGLDLFLEVLRDFADKSKKQTVVNTDDFIESLNRLTSDDWSGFINKHLSIKPKVQ